MKQYKCIIFDWDGTIADSQARIVSSIQEAARRCGFPVLSDNDSKQIIGLSLDLAILGLYPNATAEQVADMASAYSQHFLEESTVPMKTFAGATKMLTMLKASNAKVAIATGKSRRGLDQILGEFQYEAFFDMTRTPVESASKPDPLMLQQILDQFNLDVSDAIMIGDTVFDMEMAQNMGMDCLAVTHGVHELSRLLKYNPVYHCDNLSELEDWLAPRLVGEPRVNPELYPICNLDKGRVFMMPKPETRFLDESMQFYKEQGVTQIISCLGEQEATRLGLDKEGEACKKAGIKFLHFPVRDMGVPELGELQALNIELKKAMANGEGISFHCYSGRGRAGTLAVSLMIEHGMDAQSAMLHASRARQSSVPVCREQSEFLKGYSPAES